jgi:hypothetical protein
LSSRADSVAGISSGGNCRTWPLIRSDFIPALPK